MNPELKLKRGRPSKEITKSIPPVINFDNIEKLNRINLDPRMLESMKGGIILDEFFSHEGGVPCGTNIMAIGDPGVGKTTCMLDYIASICMRPENKDRKILFISGEMGRKQMFKYTQRFPQFGIVKTMFLSDYLEYNTKDVFEQLCNSGFDLILIDSLAELIDGVRDDNGWDRRTAEKWFVDLGVKQNNGENDLNLFTSFLLIQQVTKSGDFVGSNKLKHLTDAMLEMRRQSDRDGGGTYMVFSKNRNGNVDIKFGYSLTNDGIYYGTLVKQDKEEELIVDEEKM